jgi:hypothetical protein
VPAQRGYAAAELQSMLGQYFVQQSPAPEIATVAAVNEPVTGAPSPPNPAEPIRAEAAAGPRCPKCGGEMILRTARTGANQGGKFWGCSNFPRCRAVVKYALSPDS